MSSEINEQKQDNHNENTHKNAFKQNNQVCGYLTKQIKR